MGVTLGGEGTQEDPAAQVCAEIEAAGGAAVPNHDSVSDFEGAGRIIGTAVDNFGKIDIVVNNAGIVRDRTLVKMDESDYDAVIAVHQKGTFNTVRHAAPLMKDAGYGRIVNITSSAGLRGNFGQTNYGAAKAAIMGMTFVWALELGKYGITVNAVAPAGFTRMTESLYKGGEPPADQDPALNAPLIAFLASEDASYVNGQVLGRTGFAYTLFQTPRQIATMWSDGGWTPQEVADHFHEVLGQHLQPVGMGDHPLLGKKQQPGAHGRPERSPPTLGRVRGLIGSSTGRPPMDVRDKIYINGAWVPSTGKGTLEVIDSATEEVFATIPEGTPEDVDKAAQAAAAAFPAWAATSREERGKLLKRISEALAARTDELAQIISHEVGMPMTLSGSIQVGLPAGAFADAANAAESFPWEEEIGNSLVVHEPVGVVGAITPWNYPLYQIALKVAPALAVGCTVVLKPSEVAPINAFILAEVIDEVGLPPGVFNLVTGVGPVVGEAIAAHPKVDMVSFTGSTRAGRRVMELAAENIKPVSLELGGKSANILLDDADFAKAVPAGLFGCFMNSGQTCSALTRMLVPRSKLAEVEELAAGAVGRLRPGRPLRGRQAARPAGLECPARPGTRLHQQGDRRGGQAGRRRSRGARGTGQGLLRAADHLLGRDPGDDHRQGGDLRAGPLHHSLRHRGRGDRDRQRDPLRAGRRGVGCRHRAGPSGWPARCGPARSTSTAATSTRPLPSAATSSRASGASGASTASRSSSRPRRCSAELTAD